MNWFACWAASVALFVCFIESGAGQEAQPDWLVYTTLYAKGLKLKSEGQTAEAIQALEQALTLQEKTKLVSEENFADLLIALAGLYRSAKKPSQAEALNRRALAIRTAKAGLESAEVSYAEHDLAISLLDQGNYVQAGPYLIRSLKSREASLGKDHLEVADVLQNLGRFYRLSNEFSRSIAVLERCLRIREGQLAKDSEEIVTALRHLAETYQSMGVPARAEPLLVRCMQLRETRPGKDDLKVAEMVGELGNLQLRLGNLDEAEASYERALKVYRAQVGADDYSVAALLNNLGSIYRQRKQLPRAEAAVQESLRIVVGRLGENSPGIVVALNSLAQIYLDMDLLDKAQEQSLRALQIREEGLGRDDPLVAESLQVVAGNYVWLRQPDKAEPLLRRGIDILTRQMGPDHPDVVSQSLDLAEILAVQGKWDEVIALAEKSSRLLQRHVQNVLPHLSEEEQLAFLQNNLGSALSRLLALGLARENDAALAARTAEWLLNHKARAQQALAERSLLARATADPAMQDVARRLKAVREQLAVALYARPPKDKQIEHRKRIESLTAQEQLLALELNRSGGSSRRSEQWIELSNVRAALPTDAVLIEIARFNPFDYSAENPARRWQMEDEYVAWIIPPAGKGDVRVVRLGSARSIDYAIEDLQDAMAASARLIAGEGEAKAAEAIDTQLDIVSVWLHQPLEEHVANFRHLLIAPDASLWFVPWGALRLGDGRYAIEQHCVSYLLSGRNVLSEGSEKATGPALILANPDYNLARVDTRVAARQLASEPGADVEQRAATLANAWWSALPGTAAEAQAITPKLTAYLNSAPQLYMEGQALEGVVKAAQRPRVLILSTHGFFLGQDGEGGGRSLKFVEESPVAGGGNRTVAVRNRYVTAAPRAARLTGKLATAAENPLLRCGLVLAGANVHEASAQDKGDDGILTALEIVGTDLRGTELVVLSACETGLGQAHSGEGVAGLRQAFQLAGARAMATTLWKIPDQETADLMCAFFERLADGQTKADALRAAQLAMIQRRRANCNAAHPFFWAAFTLTGEWR